MITANEARELSCRDFSYMELVEYINDRIKGVAWDRGNTITVSIGINGIPEKYFFEICFKLERNGYKLECNQDRLLTIRW